MERKLSLAELFIVHTTMYGVMLQVSRSCVVTTWKSTRLVSGLFRSGVSDESVLGELNAAVEDRLDIFLKKREHSRSVKAPIGRGKNVHNKRKQKRDEKLA